MCHDLSRFTITTHLGMLGREGALAREAFLLVPDRGLPPDKLSIPRHEAPAYMMTTFMLNRLFGPLQKFDNVISALANFCVCQHQHAQQEAMIRKTMFLPRKHMDRFDEGEKITRMPILFAQKNGLKAVIEALNGADGASQGP